jgi:hypothetical protein
MTDDDDNKRDTLHDDLAKDIVALSDGGRITEAGIVNLLIDYEVNLKPPPNQRTLTYSAVLGWLVGNTDTKWADNWKPGDDAAKTLPETAWLVLDLFQVTVEQLVEAVRQEGR